MITFIALAHLAGFASALDAVITTHTSQGAVAWAVCLATFPYHAVPAYWVLGRFRFQGVAETRRENEEAIQELTERATARIEAADVQLNSNIPEYDTLVKLSEFGMTGANRVELLIDGDATYDSIVKGISKSRGYALV